MEQRRNGRQGGSGVGNWLTGPWPAASNFDSQVSAFSRGAEDAFTLGLGDRVRAGRNALVDSLQGKDLGQSYRQRMDYEHAVDRYDNQHHPIVRNGGKLVGTGAQVLLTPEVIVARGGVGIAKAAPLAARELKAIGQLGAAGGFGSQVASDVLNQRIGSVGDYVGATVGGSVGALAATTKLGSVAGAANGATTALVQDIANGRVDKDLLKRVADSARVGAATGALGGTVGRWRSDNLSRKGKEQLGETIARVRTAMRGDRTISVKKRAERLTDGRRFFPDQRTESGKLIEAKFGNFSRLSKNQTQAAEERPNFLVFQTRPRDIGAAVGAASSYFTLSRPDD